MFMSFIVFILCVYLYNRLTCGINKSNVCLVGKTALITGGNAGIGFYVALDLASRGCRVIIAARNNLEEARRKIIEQTGNSDVVCKQLDLSSFKSVKDLANDLNSTESRLDILINNSGVAATPDELTEDGLNPMMQVNYFGPFLLTHLLLDKLKSSAPSRIIFTSSYLAFVNNLSFVNLVEPQEPEGYLKSLRIYANTKLATIVASDMFAKKLAGTGVSSNSLHPGLVRTGIFQKLRINDPKGWAPFVVYQIVNPIAAKSPWEGAQTTAYLAVAKELENVSGKFFIDCRERRKPSKANDEVFCERIWNISEEVVGLSTEKNK